MIFETISLSQKQTIDALTARYGEGSCQHSFVTLYTLREKYGDTACILDGTLYVRREKLCTPDRSVCLAPLGGAALSESVGLLLEDAHARGTKLCFFTATEKACEALKHSFPGRFRFEENRDYAEYFYDTARLAGMSGPQLAKKRSNLRRFHRNCPGTPEARALTARHVPALLAFLDEWLEQNAEDHDARALLRERDSIAVHLTHFEDFGLRGVGVYVDGRLRGFSYGVPLSERVFDGLVMKGDRSICQLGVYLYQQMARFCGCPWLNAEEDLGIAGLRESKLSYRPEMLMKKYVVTEV